MAVPFERTAGMVIRMILCVVMPVNALFAQGSPVYSLADLVDSARHHLPLLMERQALVNSAQAGITEARHAYLPKLNVAEELSIGTDNDLAGSFIPLPGLLHAISAGVTDANNYQGATSNLGSLYGEYELVNFGLRGARVNSAKAFASVKQADLDKETYLVEWQIGKLYFEILKNRSLLAVDEQNILRYQSMYTISLALTGTGVNAGVDSSLAKAGLSKTRVSYNQEERALQRLEQELSMLTGIGMPTINMDTTGKKWEVSAAGLLGTQGDAGGHLPGAGGNSLAAGYDSLAIGHNPLAEYYARQIAQYHSEEDLIRKSYLPKIMVGAGGWARGSSIQYSNDYKSLSEGLGYQRLNYTAGLGITYDLFNGVHRKDRLAVTGYQGQAAGYALQQEELELHNQVLQAQEDLVMAQKNLAELPVQLQAATAAYNQKMAQYKAGIIDLVDLTNASFVLYQSQSDYIEALNVWYMASLDKSAATGNLDLFIQTVK
jgi:outer membrane protein